MGTTNKVRWVGLAEITTVTADNPNISTAGGTITFTVQGDEGATYRIRSTTAQGLTAVGVAALNNAGEDKFTITLPQTSDASKTYSGIIIENTLHTSNSLTLPDLVLSDNNAPVAELTISEANPVPGQSVRLTGKVTGGDAPFTHVLYEGTDNTGTELKREDNTNDASMTLDVVAAGGTKNYFYQVTDSAPSVVTDSATTSYSSEATDATGENQEIPWNKETTTLTWTSTNAFGASTLWQVQTNVGAITISGNVEGSGTTNDPYRQNVDAIPNNLSSVGTNDIAFDLRYKPTASGSYTTAGTLTVKQLARPGFDFVVLNGIAAGEYVDIPGVNSQTNGGESLIAHDKDRTMAVVEDSTDNAIIADARTKIEVITDASEITALTSAQGATDLAAAKTAYIGSGTFPEAAIAFTKITFYAPATQNADTVDDIDSDVQYSDGVVSSTSSVGVAPSFSAAPSIVLDEDANRYATYIVTANLDLAASGPTAPTKTSTGRGFVWNLDVDGTEDSTPSIASAFNEHDLSVSDHTSTNMTYTIRVNKFTSSKVLRVRAFAENNHGLGYSQVVELPLSASSTLTSGGGTTPGGAIL